MAAPTAEFTNGAGVIAATGEDNGLLGAIPARVPNPRLILGVLEAGTGATLVVRGKLRGMTGYYYKPGRSLKTGLPADPAGFTAVSNEAFEFDMTGVDDYEVYCSALSGGDVDLEVRVDSAAGGAAPIVQNASANNSTFSAGIALNGATGVNVLSFPDNLAAAFTWKEGSTAYMTVVTTDSAERIVWSKQHKFADSVKLAFGDGDDITVAWDGTDLDVLQAAANSSIKWGIDGAGIDHVFYGDTASAAATWDQSADSLILSGVAKIKLQTIVAAHAAAIPVTHSGSLPITQAGAETNTLADPTYLGQTISLFVDTDTSGARVVTAASRINQAGNTIITLTEVGDFVKLEAITIAGALKWQVVANDGAVLS